MPARSGLGVGRAPAMRQQLHDAPGGMGLHAREHIGDVVDRVDTLLLARGDERVEDREVVPWILAANEEEVLPAESHAPERSLRDVVVWRDAREAEESAELAIVPEDVSNGAAHSGPRLEVMSVAARPAEQLREERSRS